MSRQGIYGRTMLRRQIIALLALLTGLTAFGAPAHAAVGDMFGSQVQAGFYGKSDERRDECRLRKERERSPVRRDEVRDCAHPRPVRVVLPVVMLGSDRSRE